MSKSESEELIEPMRPVSERTLGWVLTVGGVIGLIAAFDLAVERIAMLKDPSYQPSCSINPVLSCGSVMSEPQAQVFGFPNPFIGLMAFPVVILFGAAVLSRVRLPRWMWLGMQVGTLFGAGFITWLFYQSLYSINALCPYCMVVWAVVIPIFWFTTVYNVSRGHLTGKPSTEDSPNWLFLHWVGMVVWFAVLVILIMIRFWDYWRTLL